MREIKFRGKSKLSGEWVTGIYIEGFIIRGVIEANSEYISIENWVPIHIESVGQYTGLRDKNGKDIYEGDIVEADIGGLLKYQIKFVNGRFTMIHMDSDEKYLWILDDKCEVVGNVH